MFGIFSFFSSECWQSTLFQILVLTYSNQRLCIGCEEDALSAALSGRVSESKWRTTGQSIMSPQGLQCQKCLLQLLPCLIRSRGRCRSPSCDRSIHRMRRRSCVRNTSAVQELETVHQFNRVHLLPPPTLSDAARHKVYLSFHQMNKAILSLKHGTIHTHKHTRIHIRAHTRTHTHTHAHTYTRTHIHTHSHSLLA